MDNLQEIKFHSSTVVPGERCLERKTLVLEKYNIRCLDIYSEILTIIWPTL